MQAMCFRSFMLIAGSVLGLALSPACKTGQRPAGASDPVRNSQDPAAAALVGSWAQGCISAQAQSVTSRMTFNPDGSWSSAVKMFSDTKCGNPVYEIKSEGTFVIGKATGGGSMVVTPIDRFTNTVAETFFLDAQVAANNQAGYRGHRSWQRGVPFSHPPDVSAQYDIFRVDGDSLVLGKVSQVAGSPNDGLTPQTRPTEISSEMMPLKRQ